MAINVRQLKPLVHSGTGGRVDRRHVSFKAHCQSGVPEGTQVVCFHGKPRHRVAIDEIV